VDPFVSRTDLGHYLRRDLSDDEAALIAVDAACSTCRNVAEQTFNLIEDDELRLDGRGTDWLLLPELPVVTVASVAIGTDDPLEPEDSGGDGDYLWAANGSLVRNSGGVWPRGRQNVRVTYSHGYDEIPADVRQVALSVAARHYEQGIVQYETLGQRQVRYGQPVAGDLAQTEYLILSRYRP
jgi:hypothetical protein